MATTKKSRANSLFTTAQLTKIKAKFDKITNDFPLKNHSAQL